MRGHSGGVQVSTKGSNNAPITLIEFSDFESFTCARSAAVLNTLLGRFRDVRLIFKHVPAAYLLPESDSDEEAAEYVHQFGRQIFANELEGW